MGVFIDRSQNSERIAAHTAKGKELTELPDMWSYLPTQVLYNFEFPVNMLYLLRIQS